MMHCRVCRAIVCVGDMCSPLVPILLAQVPTPIVSHVRSLLVLRMCMLLLVMMVMLVASFCNQSRGWSRW